MVGMAKRLGSFGAVASLSVGAVIFVAGCDDGAGLIRGGSDGIGSRTEGAKSADATEDQAEGAVDQLEGVPAIPTRVAGETVTQPPVGVLGQPEDVLAAVVGQLGGTPEATTMERLAKLVADLRDGDGATDVVIGSVTVESDDGAAATDPGQLMSVIVDRLGMADDSMLGEQLIVHGRAATDHDGVELIAVERRVLCRFGVTNDGLCL